MVPEALLLPRRTPGDYMLPITYENQCSACHPTTFERADKDDPRSGKPILHGLQPKDVRDWLESYYTLQFLQGNKALFEAIPGKPRPLPGKVPMPPEQRSLAERVALAEKEVFLGKRNCGECHFAASAWPETEIPKEIERTTVPQVWLKHARFDHAAHRAVDCKACHEKAYRSETHTDVLIPNLDNCTQCHAPQRKSASQWRTAWWHIPRRKRTRSPTRLVCP